MNNRRPSGTKYIVYSLLKWWRMYPNVPPHLRAKQGVVFLEQLPNSKRRKALSEKERLVVNDEIIELFQDTPRHHADLWEEIGKAIVAVGDSHPELLEVLEAYVFGNGYKDLKHLPTSTFYELLDRSLHLFMAILISNRKRLKAAERMEKKLQDGN